MALLLGALGSRGRADDVVIGSVFAWVLGLGVHRLAVTWLCTGRRLLLPYPIGFWVTGFAFAGYVLARLGRLAADALPRSRAPRALPRPTPCGGPV